MPIRSSTSFISIWRSTIRSVWKTLFVIGCMDPPEHGALETRDDWQTPCAARPPQQQRPVFVGGHGEADGPVDPAQPGGTLVLGGEAFALDLLFGLGPNPVGHQEVEAERVVSRALFGDNGVVAHYAPTADQVGQVAEVPLDQVGQLLEF